MNHSIQVNVRDLLRHRPLARRWRCNRKQVNSRDYYTNHLLASRVECSWLVTDRDFLEFQNGGFKTCTSKQNARLKRDACNHTDIFTHGHRTDYFMIISLPFYVEKCFHNCSEYYYT